MTDDVSTRRAEAEDARVVTAVAGDGVKGRLQRAAAGPLAEAQQAFNDAVLRLVDTLSTKLDAVTQRAEAAERRAAELEERLLRLERRAPSVAPARTIAVQPHQDTLPDYFAYETRMRAPADEIRERQRPYVELLRGHAPVLDAGCGRGELLALLRDDGIEARGVDANPDMVAFARGEGLDVQHDDLLHALGAVADGALGAVTALQVAEHLPPPVLARFLAETLRVLRPGGLLLAETINPVSPAALRHYFADLTHAQPLVPETLQLLAQQAGFTQTELRFANAPPPHPDDRITAQLFAPLDYALIARK